MPTPTDLVTDLPADFEVFGQAVDSTMADLKGGTTGQILSKNSNTDMDFIWIANDQGDITGVTATSPLTGGGTSGAITVGIQAASTSQSGAVQLTDSTSSTSTTTAATPNSMKSSYDLANAAIPKSTVTTNGDLIYGTGSSTVTRLGIGSSGQVLSVSGGVPAWATPSGGSNTFYAGKNKVINGDFGIWQRGSSFLTTGVVYCADRFLTNTGSVSGFSAVQSTFTAGTAPVSGYEGQFYLDIAGTLSNASTGYLQVEQRIENVRTFAGQTVTLSFWAKGSTSGIVNTLLGQNFGAGGSTEVLSATSSQSITTSWQRFTQTVTLPSIAGKTINAGNMLKIYFVKNMGSSYPTYGSSNYTGTLSIWGVQLEAGSTATDFVTASGNSYQGELAMCQRYYWRNTTGAAYGRMAWGIADTSTTVYLTVNNPVPMRVIPTSLDYSSNLRVSDTVGNQAVTAMSLNTNFTDAQLAGLTATVASGLTQNRSYFLEANNSTTSYIGLSAEL